MAQTNTHTPFTEMVDLANEKTGAKVLFSNDDFFAPKENLIKSTTPLFIPDKYTEFGKWMDGWESRRKRVPGHDFCLLKLGIPGEIYGANIDTSYFTGNFPEYASLEVIEEENDLSTEDLLKKNWTTIISKSALSGGSHNLFPCHKKIRATHALLRIFPDGGVARLRLHGKVIPHKKNLEGEINLAAVETGATVITANDMYFGPKDNLILAGRATNMGEGWETRRKRGPGHDFIIIKLCGPGTIRKIEVDTNHFKGNFPDRCMIEAVLLGEHLLPCDFRDNANISWMNILPEIKLSAHKQHLFEKELNSANLKNKYNYIKLNIYPDGGISRLRIFGEL